MCCKAVRMGMISSRQAVLSRTSRTGVQSSRSWGSKAIRMGEDLEDFLARGLAIGCSEGILTREAHILRGVVLSRIPEKTGSNTFCDGHSLVDAGEFGIGDHLAIEVEPLRIFARDPVPELDEPHQFSRLIAPRQIGVGVAQHAAL